MLSGEHPQLDGAIVAGCEDHSEPLEVSDADHVLQVSSPGAETGGRDQGGDPALVGLPKRDSSSPEGTSSLLGAEQAPSD